MLQELWHGSASSVQLKQKVYLLKLNSTGSLYCFSDTAIFYTVLTVVSVEITSLHRLFEVLFKNRCLILLYTIFSILMKSFTYYTPFSVHSVESTLYSEGTPIIIVNLGVYLSLYTYSNSITCFYLLHCFFSTLSAKYTLILKYTGNLAKFQYE